MSEYATAVVASRDGVAVAADLDGSLECINDYMSRGLDVTWETPTRAKEMLKEATASSSSRAANFHRNPYDEHRRFGMRILGANKWQVYGRHLEHVAMCDTQAEAEMVRDGLEILASARPDGG